MAKCPNITTWQIKQQKDIEKGTWHCGLNEYHFDTSIPVQLKLVCLKIPENFYKKELAIFAIISSEKRF